VAVSPAKVILFGEHFVVSGNPALSMSVDLPTVVTAEKQPGDCISVESEGLHVSASFSHTGEKITSSGSNAERVLRPVYEAANYTLRELGMASESLRITVKSTVPIGMGLGSSAATAVGTVSALTTLLNKSWSKERVFEAAYSMERLVHGHPSGVDQATVTYGGLLRYRQGKLDRSITTATPPPLIIGSTGKPRSTGAFVGKVTRLRQNRPGEYAKLASQALAICDKAEGAIQDGNLSVLGSLMNQNQTLLESVGVSCPELERLITAAISAGAFGAKLTGGGGGGCMIALADTTRSNQVEGAIRKAGGEVVPTKFTPNGVSVHLEE